MPANEANPFKPEAGDFELLSCGIKLVSAVYIVGENSATKTPITTKTAEVFTINFGHPKAVLKSV